MSARTAAFRAVACAATAVIVLARPAYARQAAPQTLDVDATIKKAALKLAAEEVLGQHAAAPADAPQIQAPAKSGSATVADSPSFAKLVGLAIDNDLAGVSNGALTLSLTPFAFRALADPSQNQPEQYAGAANTFLRRFSGTFSAGGKGESFDRNGDGKADPAESAQDLGDIVKVDLKVRLFGSRDRLDRASLDRYTAALGPDEARAAQEFLRLKALIRGDIERLSVTRGPVTYVPADKADELERIVAGPSAREAALAYGRAAAAMQALDAAAVKAIDRGVVWTAVIGTTQQAARFGHDSVRAGVRGLFPVASFDGTVNVDYTWSNLSGGSRADARSVKLAGELTRTFGDPSDDAADPKLSFAVSLERYSHVPGAKHASVAQSGIKLSLPISEKVSVPISVTYANHRDLLGTESGGVVRGNVALTWDFSGLSKKDKK